MIGDLKEVYYDQYCPKCKHWDKEESEFPCCECMTNSVQVDSHRPEKFEEAKKA